MGVMKHGLSVMAIFFVLLTTEVQASVVDQYATSVIGFSSQWSTGSWSAAQTLGAPDTNGYGDIPTSWAPLAKNGTQEFISVGFDTPIYANGVTIRETWGNGFVTQVDVIDNKDGYHTVWTGIDTSLPGTSVDFLVNWDTTNYLVTGLKIYADTNHDLYAWEEIDSIQLHGDTVAPVPLPATFWLFSPTLIGLLSVISRRKNA